MRILQVARQFYPKVGGIESCVLNLSRGLQGRGNTVEVVTLDRDLKSGERLSGPAEIDSIPIHRIPYVGSKRYPVAPSWLGFAHDFDVIHIHAIDFFADSAALTKAIGIHSKPFVVTTHGGIFHTTALLPLKNLYWRYALSRTLAVAHAVVAVSDRDAALFGTIVPEEKIITIPNGIDGAFASARGGRVRGRIVSVGRVTEGKSIEQIVRLLAQIAGDIPGVELLVAGPQEPAAADQVLQTATSLGLKSKVRLVGELPLDQLSKLVATAHLFVSAARHEGFGITTVEALAAGVPVLVTRTGIHEQVVKPGVNGWFWSGLPDEEAVAILRQALLLPDARLDEMQIAARESASPFDWSRTTEKYERVLEGAYRKSLG